MKKIFLKLIDIANSNFPKKINKVVFFSTPDYSCNPRAISEYMYENDIKMDIVWIVESLESIKNIEKVPFKVYKRTSLKGLYSFISSKYIFHNNGIYGNPKPHKSQIIFNLWHGMPLKSIGYMDKNCNVKSKNIRFSYTLATSQIFKNIIKNAFRCKSNQILLCGQPRNDLMFENRNMLMKLGINKKDYKKVFLWMPTFRKSSVENRNEDGKTSENGLPILNNEELNSLNTVLKNLKGLMIIKVHPLQKIASEIKLNLTNIVCIDNSDIIDTEEHMYSIFNEIDVLITDYSSIYVDFLLLDKPIGFMYDDFKEYKDSRGFVFEDLEELMPGQKITSLKELENFIKDVTNNVDTYKEHRDKINHKFNENNNKDNCKEILKHVGIVN